MTHHADNEIELVFDEHTGYGFACMRLQVHPAPEPRQVRGRSHFFNPSLCEGKFRTEDTYLPSERMNMRSKRYR